MPSLRSARTEQLDDDVCTRSEAAKAKEVADRARAPPPALPPTGPGTPGAIETPRSKVPFGAPRETALPPRRLGRSSALSLYAFPALSVALHLVPSEGGVGGGPSG